MLPAALSTWRSAMARYTKEEGFQSFAADIEDERSGNGVIRPPLMAPRAGGPRAHHNRRDAVRSANDAFFSVASGAPSDGPPSDKNRAASASPCGGDDTPLSTALSPSPSSSMTAAGSSGPGGGIALVSHHKVTGRQQFVYPDYDGVLSAGVVPQVIMTAEEKAEEAALRQYFISPLDMSEEEHHAFEELQMLWRNRAKSHSFLGAQHRTAAKGSWDPAATDDVVGDGVKGISGEPLRKMQRLDPSALPISGEAEAEADAVLDEDAIGNELAEALRMADDLLRFA